MSLDLNHRHGTYFITVFIHLNVRDGLDEITETYKESLKILCDLDVSIFLIFLFLLELFLVLNSFRGELMLSGFLKVFFIDFFSCFFVIPLDTVPSGNEVVDK
jgi:hypothetical protein